MALLRGYLFSIVDAEGEFARIGMARDVHAAYHRLAADFPRKLKLLDYRACSYAKFREAQLRMRLSDLKLRGDWYRCDPQRLKAAMDWAMAFPDEEAKEAAKGHMEKRLRNYPVRRDDTGERFETVRGAAQAVLGDRKLAPKIRLSVRTGCKCGPCTWSRA